MQPFGEVPRRVAWAELEGGRRYELWRTPEVRSGWHLYVYQDDVEITRLPMISETRGRMEFERRVERYCEECTGCTCCGPEHDGACAFAGDRRAVIHEEETLA